MFSCKHVDVQIRFCVIAGSAEVVALIGVFVAAAVLIALENTVLIALVAVWIALLAVAAAVLIALQIAFEHPAPFERLFHCLKIGFRQ